jgi:hypothetical protein
MSGANLADMLVEVPEQAPGSLSHECATSPRPPQVKPAYAETPKPNTKHQTNTKGKNFQILHSGVTGIKG